MNGVEGAVVLRLSLLWIGWCVLHSLLITAKVNDLVRRRGGAVRGSARLVYNAVATVTLAPLVWYQFSLPAATIFAWSGPWRAAQVLLLAYALVMAVSGKRSYEMGHFLGTAQWRAYREDREPSELPFRTNGALRWVRHPWYSGGILLIWARPLDMSAVVTNVIISAYFVVGAVLEERRLVSQFGQEYIDYKQSVSMFLPIKWIRQRAGKAG